MKVQTKKFTCLISNILFCLSAMLIMASCEETQHKPPITDKEGAIDVNPIIKPDPCIANLIENANFEASDKEELKPGISVGVPSGTKVGINFDYVSEEMIKLQVNRNKDPFNIQMGLAINLAQCMDNKAKEYMMTDAYKALSKKDQEAFQSKSYNVTSKYRTQCLEMIMSNAGQKPETPTLENTNIVSKEHQTAILKASLVFLQEQNRINLQNNIDNINAALSTVQMQK